MSELYKLDAEQRKIIEEEDTMSECEIEKEKYIENYGYSPCEGCMRFNCKSCKYGDDGNYTKYDIYSMSELL